EGLEKIGVRHPTIEEHSAKLRTEAHRLASELEAYYTPMMKKNMYYEAYYAANAKYSHRDHMRSRHSGYAADRGHYFPLHDVNGYLIAEIGSVRYLVDTGRPHSIGDGSPLL